MRHRRFFKHQEVVWSEIAGISVVEREQGSGKSRKSHWWVLAESTGPSEKSSIKRRIGDAVIAFNASDLAPMLRSGEEAATSLRDQLDDFLKAARTGTLNDTVNLLPVLREVALAAEPVRLPERTQKVSSTPRSRSVIER